MQELLMCLSVPSMENREGKKREAVINRDEHQGIGKKET